MRLTAVHVQYWHARTSPAWARGKAGMPIVSVHECVNAHAPGPTPLHADITRLCDVLQGAPKEAIRGELGRIASMPNDTRYYATAKKWLKRLQETDARAWWQGRAGLTGADLDAYDRASPPFVWSQRPVRVVWMPDLPAVDPSSLSQAIEAQTQSMADQWREQNPEIVRTWQTPTGRLASHNAEFHNMKPRPYQLAALDTLLSTTDLRPRVPRKLWSPFKLVRWPKD
jgi:hypothetical protein